MSMTVLGLPADHSSHGTSTTTDDLLAELHTF